MSCHSSRASRDPRIAAVGLTLLLAAGVACDSRGAPTDTPPDSTAAPRAVDTADAAVHWRAGFVVVDGVYGTELVAPWDVLEHVAHQPGVATGIELLTVSPDGEPIRTAEGLTLVPDHGFDDAPPIDILVVPSSRGSRDLDLEDRRLISFVRQRGERARLVMSLCWGSFVLAESGLLDGHAVTTFPADYHRFSRRYPDLDLRVNVSFVHDGRFLTSQGGVLSYDVAMYLIDLVFGTEVAEGVGRGLLIPWPRSSGAEPPPFVSDIDFGLAPPQPR